MRTHLYRHYDSEGVLLYVGISLSAIYRLAQHEKAADWAQYIARVEIETFKTRRDAENAERDAIEREEPIFNKAYNGGRRAYRGVLPTPVISQPDTDAIAAYRPPSPEGEVWLTFSEAAKHLKTSNSPHSIVEAAVQRIVDDVRGHRRGGAFFWRKTDLDDYLQKKRALKLERKALRDSLAPVYHAA